jgi:hypothetical protein
MNAKTPTTYLNPTIGRPTRETLSQALDFNPPSRFAEYVGQLYDFSKGDPRTCLDGFDATLGLFPCGRSARYPGTPPELFPIGRTGCDGDHYGFLLHAPELELEDLPFCHYCPMDSDGVIIVGSGTEKGIATVMAVTLSYDFVSIEEKSLITEIARACNIRPQVEQNPMIPVPEGWQFLPSSDGVGTIAPASLFDSQMVVKFDQYKSADPFACAAELAIRGGYLATALHYLREGLWFFRCKQPRDLTQRMVDVYEMMNRPQLAMALTQTMSKRREAAEA